MTLEERVKRLESLMTTSSQPEAVSLHTAIRRDLAAEEAGDDGKRSGVDPDYRIIIDGWMERCRKAELALFTIRAQVADLTRELDRANGALSVCGIDLRAAIARAEKADECAKESADIMRRARGRADEYMSERDDLRAQLTDRDATIAEARWLLDVRGASDMDEWRDRRDAWLAGQPAPVAHSCEAAEKAIERLEADLAAARAEVAQISDLHAEVTGANDLNRIALKNARAEVARLEGLLARCEAWFSWWISREDPHHEDSESILRDLRAGRAAT